VSVTQGFPANFYRAVEVFRYNHIQEVESRQEEKESCFSSETNIGGDYVADEPNFKAGFVLGNLDIQYRTRITTVELSTSTSTFWISRAIYNCLISARSKDSEKRKKFRKYVS
jgi:hypothetical protein